MRMPREEGLASANPPTGRMRIVLSTAAVIAIATILALSAEVRQLRRAEGIRRGGPSEAFVKGTPAPDIDLAAVPAGHILRLPSQMSGPTLLYFFTTPCPYCAASLVQLDELLSKAPDTELIGIALDGPELAGPYVQSNGVAWSVLAAPTPEVAAALRVNRVPLLVLYGADVTVVRSWVGQVTGDTVAEVIAELRAIRGRDYEAR